MVIGGRLLIIAVGLALLCGANAQSTIPSSVTNPTVEKPSDHVGGQKGDQTEKSSFPVGIVNDSEKLSHANRREAEADQRERDNLSAQQSVAKSTEQVVFISWWQLGIAVVGSIIALVGTGGLFYSLALNRRATDAAIKAVGAERAWLTFDMLEMGPVKFSDGDSFGFIIRWKNTGRSPAIKVSLYTDYAIVLPLEKISTFIPNELKPDDSIAHLGANASISSQMRSLNPKEADSVSYLVVYGRAEYSDLFSNEPRVSEVCGRVTIYEQGQPNGPPNRRFILSPAGPQNSIN